MVGADDLGAASTPRQEPSQIPENVMKEPSEEHLRFMHELVENVKKMLGGDPMVAAIGEEQNGCYAVIISVNQLPPQLVMMTIVAMMSEQILKDMGKRYNDMCAAHMQEGSKFVN